MLCPPSVMAPLQLPPEVLLARMLLTTVTVNMPESKMAAPLVALLPEKVLLVTVICVGRGGVGWVVTMGRPKPAATLPENVLLVTFSVPQLLLMAPPSVLACPFAMVRFSTVNVRQREFSEHAKFTTNTPTVPPPLMVMTPPPSI